MEYIVGQRWVSQTEPQLGLGIIVNADRRQVTVHFPAIEEDRIYASNSSPLARISFQPGDAVSDIDNQAYTVKAVENMNGLHYYLVENADGEQILPENKLSSAIELSQPVERLFSGQFDRNRLFQLRAATLHYNYVQQQSESRGLLGPRTNLLAHQLYIAHEVASRYAPRVLLADEVGLGKTIEAGMILHHQLKSGLASRVLIVVPEPLLHQWLVEMLRKFNLHFALFDQQRYQELLDGGNDNPFDTEQLILCGLEFMANNAETITQSEWDLVIIDEAHHLEWNESADTPESRAYRTVEALGAKCHGMLLLTATPEQIGVESHFARLRLLDPSRFDSLEHFVEEQQNFVELSRIVDNIQNESELSGDDLQLLADMLGSGGNGNGNGNDNQAIDLSSEAARHKIISDLLDRHGTSRTLFRNTRAAIKNFPKRLALPHPLDNAEGDAPCKGLWPELKQADWLKNDPRVAWLEGLLKELRKEKILLICANTHTAVDLEHHLHLNRGVRSTAFYEDLSILERDRAAAYFADPDGGAQVMICSEIGSEGRNFQFAHHLILFDLPTNPDLLEQRIGRLDRIGQSEDIKIHIPYIKGTAQEYLFRWYNEGVNAFEKNFSAGAATFDVFSDRLQPYLGEDLNADDDAFVSLIADTQQHVSTIRHELEHGRDHLLELNSLDNDVAEGIIENIATTERSQILGEYSAMLFDSLGVEQEYHSEGCYVIRPTEQMLLSEFPYLSDEGATITFTRDIALQREDIEFLTWEHPMISESMEQVLAAETGNSSIGTIKIKALPPGTVLLECFYSIQASAPKKLQLHRFLPSTPIRVLRASNGKDLTDAIKHPQLNKLREHLKRSARFAIVKQARPVIEQMIEQAQHQADKRSAELIASAEERATTHIGNEINRLKALQQLNGSVRQQEIDFYEATLKQTLACIDQAKASVQAVRVIINTH